MGESKVKDPNCKVVLYFFNKQDSCRIVELEMKFFRENNLRSLLVILLIFHRAGALRDFLNRVERSLWGYLLTLGNR